MIHLPCIHELPASPEDVLAARLPAGYWNTCGKANFGKHKAFVSPCREDARHCGDGCPGFEWHDDVVEIECVEFGPIPPKPKRVRPQQPDVQKILQVAVGPSVKVSVDGSWIGKCKSLGERITFETGCTSGFICKWNCASENPQVIAQHAGNRVVIPRDDCGKDCPGYVA